MGSLKLKPATLIRSIIRLGGLGILHALRLIKGAGSLDDVFMPRIALSFQVYMKHRDKGLPRDFSGVRDAGTAGLVSVILPVYNGEEFLAEAIDSVLSQTHVKFELIIVDDGSTDQTPNILNEYSTRDARIIIIRQANQKLPRALNTGFRRARGQYLTWTSHDNRMKPDCLARMVACLDENPQVDMVYANYEIIGEDGRRIEKAPFCEALQEPAGSGMINLPKDVSIIQYVNGNFIGPAFLYRLRVLDLVGDYSPHWFTCEDYDYFLRVNEQMTLRRLETNDSIYEYRIHRASLSAAGRELRIDERTEALMAFDDHRRDIAIGPVAWRLDASGLGERGDSLARQLCGRVRKAGDIILNDNDIIDDYEMIPRVFLRVAEDPNQAKIEPGDHRKDFDTFIFVFIGKGGLPGDLNSGWDLCLTNVNDNYPLALLEGHRRSWLAFTDVPTCVRMVRLRAFSDKMASEEKMSCTPTEPLTALSVIICTCRGGEQLAVLLDSLRTQTLAADHYELVIVNNDPENRMEAERIEKACEGIHPVPDRLRVIGCRPAGLSRARNAGLAHARGEVVLFLDDDAVADERLLEEILKPYEEDKDLGVAGGVIDLEPPNPAPVWMGKILWPYWSHFHPEGRPVEYLEDWKTFPYGANWSARRDGLLAIGGFRTAYGRNGTLVDSGEETVAAILMKKSGRKVAAVSGARVVHKVNPGRFSLINLLRTVRGGYDVAIQQEMDHYVDFRLNLLELLVHGVKRLGHSLWPGRLPLSRRVYDLCIMAGCFHGAMKLARLQILRLVKRQ